MGRISVEMAIAASHIAEQMLSDKERKVLSRFDAEIKRLKREFNAEDADDEITQQVFVNVPGSREVLDKWADMQEKLRLAGRDN